jgi:3-phosphoshikimate 1-carboxyvinyltransferase
MCIKVYPSEINGQLKIPASKSYTQRALVACLLTQGQSIICNPGQSEDEQNIVASIKALGAKIQRHKDYLTIQGGLSARINKINTGESGLGIRLIAPVAALLDQEILLEGKGSILKRPMHIIESAIRDLGGYCWTNKGYLPIKVKGPLKGGEIELDGSLSSQFLSGLLFALPLAKKDSVIHVNNLQSKPYVDLTLDVLEKHGIEVNNQNHQKFTISGNQKYLPAEYSIESDWSNGAFLLVAAAISGNLKLYGLNPDSLQGDKKVLEALTYAGVDYEFIKDHYAIRKTNNLRPFEFDATQTPDLFPPLAVLAAHCNGRSYLRGAKRLVHKESNRAESLISELSRVGIEIRLKDENTIEIKGGKVKGGGFDSHGDHRIAMAGAILALNAEKAISITNHKAVNKSYPDFFSNLKTLKVKIDNTD